MRPIPLLDLIMFVALSTTYQSVMHSNIDINSAFVTWSSSREQ